MAAKELVKKDYPSARAEYRTLGWVILMAGATEAFARGKTERIAWNNAKKKVINNSNF